MTREILFRGQTRKRGEKVNMLREPIEGNWVYGGIFQGKGDKSIIYTYDPVGKYVVYSDTVGQYTGLTDKNGMKIFEGDIMQFSAYGLDYKGTVSFDNGAFFVSCMKASPFLFDVIKREGIVIGNIHDNPELMGGEDDE